MCCYFGELVLCCVFASRRRNLGCHPTEGVVCSSDANTNSFSWSTLLIIAQKLREMKMPWNLSVRNGKLAKPRFSVITAVFFSRQVWPGICQLWNYFHVKAAYEVFRICNFKNLYKSSYLIEWEFNQARSRKQLFGKQSGHLPVPELSLREFLSRPVMMFSELKSGIIFDSWKFSLSFKDISNHWVQKGSVIILELPLNTYMWLTGAEQEVTLGSSGRFRNVKLGVSKYISAQCTAVSAVLVSAGTLNKQGCISLLLICWVQRQKQPSCSISEMLVSGNSFLSAWFTHRLFIVLFSDISPWCFIILYVPFSVSQLKMSPLLQASLNKLMETLGQAEPYFVKCIRSNAEKVNSDL